MAGNTVTVDGALDAKGTYGLIRVLHRWTRQGYTNDFACTPWKQYRNPEPPPARTWSGIVSARVTGHNDPKKMGRIQVQFFWQEDGSSHWARATSPHAGPDRGFMFMPEVGDEVAVAVEDGDPERPVIIGSLWNGVQQAPRFDFYGNDIATNNVKRILTKAGNRLQIVDEPGNETIVLATPNHSSITLSETLQGTKRTNVAIESDGDITLSAPNGRVHIIAYNRRLEQARLVRHAILLHTSLDYFYLGSARAKGTATLCDADCKESRFTAESGGSSTDVTMRLELFNQDPQSGGGLTLHRSDGTVQASYNGAAMPIRGILRLGTEADFRQLCASLK